MPLLHFIPKGNEKMKMLLMVLVNRCVELNEPGIVLLKWFTIQREEKLQSWLEILDHSCTGCGWQLVIVSRALLQRNTETVNHLGHFVQTALSFSRSNETLSITEVSQFCRITLRDMMMGTRMR
jgi:hypothetical protein